MLAAAPHSSSPIDAARSPLVLRVRGSALDGRVLRLEAAKCTIGSDPHCTLRLRARGIEPVHCIILRGSNGTVIRRWSAATRLNGRSFADAPLQTGDHLSIGPIDLEVIDPGTLPRCLSHTSPLAEERARDTSPDTTTQPAKRFDRRAARARVRRLVRLVRAERETAAGLKADLCHLRAAEGENLRRLQEERDDLAQRAAEARCDLDALKIQHQATFDLRSAELDARAAELDARLAASTTRDTESQARSAQLDEREAHLQSMEDDLAARREAAAQRTPNLDETATQSSRDEPTADQGAEMESASRDDRIPDQSVDFESVSSRPPVDLASVLRSVGAASLLAENEPDPSPTEDDTPPASARSRPIEASSASPAHEEEDIDDYMARLLERVRSAGGSAAIREPQAAAPQTRRSKEREAPAAEPVAVAEDAALKKPTELSPRAVAPERKVDLSVLREVANISAQSHLDSHSRRQLERRRRSKLIVACVSIAAAVALAGLCIFFASKPVAVIGMFGAVVITLAFVTQYALLRRRLRGARKLAPERLPTGLSAAAPQIAPTSTETPPDEKPLASAN